MSAVLKVITAPVADPGVRIHGVAPEGATIAEIVEKCLPGLPQEQRAMVRVTLNSRRASIVVDGKRWDRVRPKAHVTIVIRVVPEKDALRSILQIVIAVAAVALGQYWGAALATSWQLGATGAAFLKAGLTVGLNVIGSLALNALIPPAAPSSQDRKTNYTITGWKNRIEPNAVIPDPCGKHRYAPPCAIPNFATMKGDDEMWITAVFLIGYGSRDPAGGLALSDMKIGDTSLSEFDPENYVLEVREGLPSDGPLTLIPYTTWQENIGVELTRPYPRSETGKVQDDEDTIETPVVRYSGANASGASILLTFPAGLGKVNKEGKERSLECEFRIRQKLVGTNEWQPVETISIRAKKMGEGFTRQYSWTFPSRGIWAVEVTRLTDEHTSTQEQSRSTWEALQTIRPEYPINEKKPMAFVALHIKATHQLNGNLDSFNLIVSRRCKDYDQASGTWLTRETSNPASIMRYKMQGLAAARPAPDSAIDLASLADWHDFCRIKTLKYDRVQDDAANHLERLIEVARAGRASPWHDGRRRTVVIDRPDKVAIDEVSMRNAGDISVRRVYLKPPHAFRVTFNDATNNYEPAERLVRWPGYEGEITLTEQLSLPGKTNPDEIYVEAKRRMYEAIYRQDSISWMQNGATRTATRGDHVLMSFETFDEAQVAGRVRSVTGSLIELDAEITMVAGKSYAALIRVYADSADEVGATELRAVVTDPGTRRTFTVTGMGGMPAEGDMLHFGESGKVSQRVLVTQVEEGEEFSGHYRGAPAAPEIDELTDALVIEPWSSLVGQEISENFQQPPAPRFVGLDSGVSGTGTTGAIEARLTAGAGPVYSARFVVEHRLLGASAWIPINIPAIAGGAEIKGVYANGAHVQLRAKALSLTGVSGPYGPVVSVLVGDGDVALPASLDASKVTVVAQLGGALIDFQTSDNAATTQVQLFHSTTATVNTTTDAVGDPIDVKPSRLFSIPYGDVTRVNLLDNGGFASAASWMLGTGWSIASGKATHAAGTASAVTQAEAMDAGKQYRIAYTVTGRTAGTVAAQLTGGSTRNGVSVSANGTFSDRIQAATGNATFGLSASAPFDGSLDDVVLFEETATCLAAGTHFFWLQPLNDDGVGGTLAGPFSVQIL